MPGCTSDWTKVGNLIDSKDPSAQMVQEPRINVPPTLANSAVLPVTAQSITPNVTFRYTLDGSRPTEQSPEMPRSARKAACRHGLHVKMLCCVLLARRSQICV